MKSAHPLLSVIVPVYNASPYIRRCLDSILAQKYKNLEIICVDDGSTDDSGDIIDSYAKIDSRIKVVHKTNGGLVSARKAGTKEATGEYITNVDSDDWVEAGMYEDLMNCIVEAGADVITSCEIRDYGHNTINTKCRFVPGEYEGERLKRIKESLVSTEVFYQCNLSGHVVDKIYKTEKYKLFLNRVSNAISIGEDVAVSYPYILDSKKIVITDKHYYHYCLRPDSLMGMKKEGDLSALEAFKTYITEVFSKYKEVLPNAIVQSNIMSLYAYLFRNIEGVIKYDGDTLYPYGQIKSNESVMVFGAGKYGVQLYEYLKGKKWFRNLIWADSYGLNGAQSIKEVDIDQIDKVIIGALHYEVVEDIVTELKVYGIPEKEILSVPITDELRKQE